MKEKILYCPKCDLPLMVKQYKNRAVVPPECPKCNTVYYKINELQKKRKTKPSIWDKVVRRDNYKCLYCKENDAEFVCHLLPEVLGEMNDGETLLSLCSDCWKKLKRRRRK